MISHFFVISQNCNPVLFSHGTILRKQTQLHCKKISSYSGYTAFTHSVPTFLAILPTSYPFTTVKKNVSSNIHTIHQAFRWCLKTRTECRQGSCVQPKGRCIFTYPLYTHESLWKCSRTRLECRIRNPRQAKMPKEAENKRENWRWCFARCAQRYLLYVCSM